MKYTYIIYYYIIYLIYLYNFKDCNRCYSTYKVLRQHKKRCEHFETTISESDVSKKVNINDTTFKLNFCKQNTEFEWDNMNDVRC